MAENVCMSASRRPAAARDESTRVRRRRLARIHPGTLPGTLPPSEAPSPVVIRVVHFDGGTARESQPPSIDEALRDVVPGGVTWIDVDGLGDHAVLARLGEHFALHPLALEDVVNIPQRPKVERYSDHYFIVLRMVRLGHDDEQVSMFFGRDWVVTLQERPGGDVFDPVRAAIREGRGRVRSGGADFLTYLLLDAVVDAYFPVLEVVGEQMDALETEALTRPSVYTLRGIEDLRRDVTRLRRAVWPLREEIAILQREESSLVAPETRVFLRDTYDHAVQALDVVETLRETRAALMEVYLSAQNQRLNEVMKVLTVIATLFIPLTFIASIYGMNFKHMPELEWRYGYAWALGLMAAAAAGMIAYFRRRGWW
jgi:magnesium transporter